MTTAPRKGTPVIASVSGGKDSTALCLHLQELGIPYRAVHMDTGWEHPATDEYIRKVLEPAIGPIEWIRGPLLMRELILKKGIFPSRRARYCTQLLKIFPMMMWIEGQYGCNAKPHNAVGVRAEESKKRAKLGEYQDMEWVMTWRPLLKWELSDVIAIHKRHNVTPNPLYTKGANRVGCWPCVFSSKAEIAMVAKIDPGRIDEIREMETALFYSDRTRKRLEDGPVKWLPSFFCQKKGKVYQPMMIDEAVAWSQTLRGGRHTELFYDPDRSGCMRWGLCDV